jgi:nucleotide-binding universal stress UspA family protein
MESSIGPIVIPVDGSLMAVQVLPLARYLAERLRRRILLAYTLAARGDFTAPAIRDAWSYVEDLGRQTLATGVSCEATVVAGDATAALLELAEDSGASCIVLGGRFASNPGRGQVGTLARHLLQRASVPVLIQAPGTSSDVGGLIVVRQDGSRRGSAASPAVGLPRPYRRGLHLVQAQEPIPPVRAGAMSTPLVELTAEEAVAYLQDAA